jgi:hypothetical protein
MQELGAGNLLVDDPARPAAFQLVDALRAPLYRQLLETSRGPAGALVCEARPFRPDAIKVLLAGTSSIPTTIAYVRAKFFSGRAEAES